MDTKASAQRATSSATTYNLIAAVVGVLALVGAGIVAFGPLRPMDCSGFRCETNAAAALGLFVGLAIAGCMPAVTLMACSSVLSTLGDVLRAVGAPAPVRAVGASELVLPSSAEFTGAPGPADRGILIRSGTNQQLVLMAGTDVSAIEDVISERWAERRLTELGYDGAEGRDPGNSETHLALDGRLHEVARIYDLGEGQN